MAGTQAGAQTRLTDFSEILQASSYTVETRSLKFREKSGVLTHTWTPSTLGGGGKGSGPQGQLKFKVSLYLKTCACTHACSCARTHTHTQSNGVMNVAQW